REYETHIDSARAVRYPSGPGRTGRRRCRVLLLLRQERGHPSARAEGVHLVGSRQENRDLHGAAEVRGQRPRFRHGHPDAEPAQAARDATRLLQASRGVHDHEETRDAAVETAASPGTADNPLTGWCGKKPLDTYDGFDGCR